MDDERLKNPPGPGHTDYFDELLERIRDIRASERRFYQKVLDIYATSVDYRPDTDDFLRASGRQLLDHAGTISAEVAKAKAEREYERYQAREDAKPRAIDAAFEATARQLKKPSSTRAKKARAKS